MPAPPSLGSPAIRTVILAKLGIPYAPRSTWVAPWERATNDCASFIYTVTTDYTNSAGAAGNALLQDAACFQARSCASNSWDANIFLSVTVDEIKKKGGGGPASGCFVAANGVKASGQPADLITQGQTFVSFEGLEFPFTLNPPKLNHVFPGLLAPLTFDEITPNLTNATFSAKAIPIDCLTRAPKGSPGSPVGQSGEPHQVVSKAVSVRARSHRVRIQLGACERLDGLCQHRVCSPKRPIYSRRPAVQVWSLSLRGSRLVQLGPAPFFDRCSPPRTPHPNFQCKSLTLILTLKEERAWPAGLILVSIGRIPGLDFNFDETWYVETPGHSQIDLGTASLC